MKLKRNFTLAFLLCLVLGITPVFAQVHSECLQGNGEPAEVQRDLGVWQGIAVEGVFEINVTAGAPEPRVELSGDSNILPHVRTQVDEKGVLHISLDRSVCLQQPLRLDLAAARLNTFHVSGTNTVTIDGLQQEQFKLKVFGANDVNLSGRVEQFSARVDGTSMLTAADLDTKHSRIAADGTAAVRVHVTQHLEVNASGLAEVTYSGNPKQVEPRLSALAAVTALSR